MFERKILVILSVINILMISGLVVGYLTMDKEPPVIRANAAAYSKDTTEQELLSGIQAFDQKDGDVSNTVVIEKIVPNQSTMTVWVSCGAKDSSGNVSKYTVSIPCDESVFEVEEETGEVFQLAIGEAENMITPLEAETLEGENAEETSDTELETVEEIVNEETESIEESGEEDAPVVEEIQTTAAPEGNPILVFSVGEVKTKKGYNPAWVTVISQLKDDTDSYEELLRKIKIQGEFDNTVVGSYDVLVSTTDHEGNESTANPIRIIVEE